MISLKEWNSFDSKTREAILNIVGSSLNIFNREYHHNFDYDAMGKKLKQILGHCYKQPDNTIKVCVTITPAYATKIKIPKSIEKIEENEKYCEYCGKEIEDTNDTGSLCYRCYMKEYYPDERDL